MKTYARILDGTVAEMLTTVAAPAALFHPSLLWIDVSSMPSVAIGWEYDGSHFSAPPPHEAAVTNLSIEELQSRLTLLGVQIAALRKP